MAYDVVTAQGPRRHLYRTVAERDGRPWPIREISKSNRGVGYCTGMEGRVMFLHLA